MTLPAPAIAVNGRDGYQIWFSLLEPVRVPQAEAFLDALRRRYLGDIVPVRVAMLLALDTASGGPPRHARPVAALQVDSSLWSAFVASDIASMFADEPWLDMPPNPDGQAQLLAPLKSIPPAGFELALQQLRPTTGPATPGLASNAAAPAAGLVKRAVRPTRRGKRFTLNGFRAPGIPLTG